MHASASATASVPTHIAGHLIEFLKATHVLSRRDVMRGEEAIGPEGDPGALIVHEGLILVLGCHEDGSRSAIELLRPGTIFGLDASDWDGDPKVLRPIGRSAEAFRVPRRLVTEHQGGLRDEAHIYRRRLKDMARRASYGSLPVEGRILRAFRDLIPQSEAPETVWLDMPRGMSQEDLSLYVGASRETVSRILADLRREGRLRKRGRYYQVHFDTVFPEGFR